MGSQGLQWMGGLEVVALANETRLSMFQNLRSKELECNASDGACSFTDHCCSVRELVANLEETPATVSHHLKRLSPADLVGTKRRERFIYCSMNESAAERLEEFIRNTMPASAAVS